MMLHSTNDSKWLFTFIFIAISTSFIHCGPLPEETEEDETEPPFQCEEDNCRCEEDAVCTPTDLFALDHVSSHYRPFSSSDAVNTQDGFGIYHDESESVGSIVNFGSYELNVSDGAGGAGGAGGSASGTYENTLSVVYDASSWMSIRRAFREQADFCGCSGVAFDIFPIENRWHDLRFTLADLECTEALYEDGEDELWWSYISDALDGDGAWKTIRLPFDSFEESYGAGTRHNNGELGLKCIQAIEFSIFGRTGEFLIRNVRTYAD